MSGPSSSSHSFLTPMVPNSSGMHGQWPGMLVLLASGNSRPSSMNGYPVLAVMNSEGGGGTKGPVMYQLQMPGRGANTGVDLGAPNHLATEADGVHKTSSTEPSRRAMHMSSSASFQTTTEPLTTQKQRYSKQWRDAEKRSVVFGQRHRPHIPTDRNGEVIQLRSKWHNTIRYLAKRELDLGKRNILEHPKSKLELIANEVEDMFTYNTPLKEGTVRVYLLSSLQKSRHHWKAHFMATGKRHPGCPEEVFPRLKSYWTSEQGQDESATMQQRVSLRNGKRKTSNSECHDGNNMAVNVDEEDADFSTPSLQWKLVDEERSRSGRPTTQNRGHRQRLPKALKSVQSESNRSDDEPENMVDPESIALSTAWGTAAPPSAMADANRKIVVEMEIHNFRVNISELKAAVAKVGAAVTGFEEQLWGIASQIYPSKGEEKRLRT